MEASSFQNNFNGNSSYTPSNRTTSSSHNDSSKSPSIGYSMTLLDGTFFKYLPEKSTDIKTVGLCMLCLPKIVEIRGHSRVGSNFTSHLKRIHGQHVVEEYQNYSKIARSNRGI